jgi:hypothetical protein
MGPQERVLGDLLGIRMIAQHAIGDRPHPAAVALHDRTERSIVAPNEATDQGSVLIRLD